MHGAKDGSMSCVSRRTRSRSDVYYKKLHDEVKQNRIQETNSGTCNESSNVMNDDVDEQDSMNNYEEEIVLSSDDSDDSHVNVDFDDSEKSSDEEEEDSDCDYRSNNKKRRRKSAAVVEGREKLGRSEKIYVIISSDDEDDEECKSNNVKEGRYVISDADNDEHKSNNVNKGRKVDVIEGKRKPGRPPKRKACQRNRLDVISSSDDDNDDEDDEEYKSKKINKRRKVDMQEGKRKPGRPPKKKACQRSKLDVIGDLVEYIWKQNTVIDESPVVVEKKATSISTLPLKFRFEDNERSFVREKTNEEKEIESLFRELEIGLWESEVGCTNPSMTDGGDSGFDERATPCCGRGVEDGVLDEQIGIICKWCSRVLLDIKDVLPPFFVESPDRREKKHTKESKNSTVKFDTKASSDSDIKCYINSEGTVLDLIPDTGKDMYPHQLEGFKFMWKNVAGDIHIKNLKNLSSSRGGGCVISHAPGTGKTRLSIVFLQTFLKLYANCHPVIIAPCGMLMTWEQEFRKWNVGINFVNLNDKKLNCSESQAPESLGGYKLDQEKDRDYVRFVKLSSWMKGGSILGVSYRLFERLAGDHKKIGSNEEFRKMLLELPSILFLDEGHTPRNNQSLMWKSLTMVKTQRRVILSGTLFQNNFDELYNTLSLINPKFPLEVAPLQKKRGRKRKNNGWDYLTSSICKSNDSESDQVKKLRSMIKPFIHVHKGDILEKNLPGMKECLICLRPTDLQSELLRSITQVDEYLDQSHLASLISIHPSLAALPSLITKNPAFSTYKKKLSILESDPNAGVKTRFLIELIRLSTRLGEKVLVFSQNIDPLLHIKKLLKSHFLWNEGHEVIYMTGHLTLQQRQCSISSFNDKSGNAKVLLASEKACSEGISLVGASRVVFLDVAWNPSVETQAISRAYRIGQERIVYVYHLVTEMEVKKFARQAGKERISKLIFSPGEEEGGRTSGSLGKGVVEEDKVLDAMVRNEGLKCIFEKIVHQPKEANLDDTYME